MLTKDEGAETTSIDDLERASAEIHQHAWVRSASRLYGSVVALFVDEDVDYAGDDARFRSVGHLEQDVDGLFTEVDAVSLNVVTVDVHVGSLYAREAVDDGVVEAIYIPVVTDNASVDANDVPVEADFLSVARTDAREGTNKTGVATHFLPVVTDYIGEETNKTGVATHFAPVVTDPLGEATNKTDVAPHFVPVVTDSIGEGTNKTVVATDFLPVVTDSIGEGTN